MNLKEARTIASVDADSIAVKRKAEGFIECYELMKPALEALRDSPCTCHPPSDFTCKRCEALRQVKEGVGE